MKGNFVKRCDCGTQVRLSSPKEGAACPDCGANVSLLKRNPESVPGKEEHVTIAPVVDD